MSVAASTQIRGSFLLKPQFASLSPILASSISQNIVSLDVLDKVNAFQNQNGGLPNEVHSNIGLWLAVFEK